MTRARRVAVYGLGAMGAGMARSLMRAGHDVHGADVDAAAVGRLHADGGASDPPAAVADRLDAVVVVVLTAAQTDSVLFGPDGIVPRLSPGAVVLSCATIAPEAARRLAARCAETGVLYLDAPISGGAAKAAEGRLSIMASGPAETFEAARFALDAMAETVFEIGAEVGQGSAMKAVNQLLAGVHIAAMGEALTFAMTQGVAPETFLSVIPECAGTSWMLENRAPHVAAGDYTPLSRVDIWPKDLGIVLDIARSAKFPTPIAAAAMQQWLQAQAQGLGGEDDAAIAKVYARAAGLALPGDGE